MNAVKKYYNPSINESSTVPFNLANYVSNIISDQTLSKNASTTLVQLTLSAGRKGYCELLIYSISVKVKSSRTQTKLYLKELQDKKRIKIIYRTGRSSIYQLLDILPERGGPSRFSDYIKEIKKRKNQRSERPNVILNFHNQELATLDSIGDNTKQVIATKPALHEEINTVANAVNNTDPAQETVNQSTKVIATSSTVLNTSSNTLFDINLLREILQVTGDKKSTACFIKIVKNCPKNIIYAAISSLKIAMEEGYILRPGGYFVGVIKNYFPEVFNTQTSPVILSTKNNSSVVPLKTSKEPCFEPDEIVPASQEVAMQAINKIKLILNKSLMI